jgi:hypothetical protein
MTVDQARDALRAHLARGVKQRYVAKALGMSPATVSLFVAGKYSGDSEAVAGRVEQYLALEARREDGLGSAGFVRTTAAGEVQTALGYAHENCDIALVYGESGTGKTVAAKRYCETHPGVAYVLLDPTSGQVRPFVSKLLWEICRERLGQSEPLMCAVERLVDTLRDSGRLLILDEAQHLAWKAVEVLRRLHDEAGLGIALVGHTMLHSRLFGGGNSIYAQMYSRVGMSRYIAAAPTARDVAELAEATLAASRKGGACGKLEDRAMGYLVGLSQQPGCLRTVVKCLRLARAAAESPDGVDEVQLRWAGTHLMGREV